MKRYNKALYEQIMRNVSKEVKRSLNEAKNMHITNHPIFDDITDLAVENNIDPSSKEWVSLIKNYLKTIATKTAKSMNDYDIVNIFQDWACGKPYNYGFTERDYIRYINKATSMKDYVDSDNTDPVYDSNLTIITMLLNNIDETIMESNSVFDYETFINEVDGDGEFQIMELISDIIAGRVDVNTFDIMSDYDNPYNDFVAQFTKAD